MCVALRAPYDRVDARDQFVLVERLGHVVVGAEAQAPNLVLDTGEAGENQDRSLYLRDSQGAQHLVSRHVRQIQVQENDVVVVELAEIDALFAQIRCVDIEALGFEHQLNRLSGGAVILDQQDAHASPLHRRAGLGSRAAAAARENALGQTDAKP